MASVTEKLGKKMQALRKTKRLSQEELAYQAKIDYSYLNQVEAGKRNISIKRLERIAKVLKVPLKELFE